MRRGLVVVGLAILALAWLGPLPAAGRGSLAAQMALHMLVVAVAAPILAAGMVDGISGRRLLAPIVASPLVAGLADFVVIWGWHAPALHEAARTSAVVLALEQGTFLLVGLMVWLSALARPPEAALAGAGALLFTSMHMTLLGVLIGLAPNPICTVEGARPVFGLTLLEDQQLGGMVMLATGGAAYLLGGLMLVARLLRLKPRGDGGIPTGVR